MLGLITFLQMEHVFRRLELQRRVALATKDARAAQAAPATDPPTAP